MSVPLSQQKVEGLVGAQQVQLASEELTSTMDRMLPNKINWSTRLVCVYFILLLGWLTFPLRVWLWQRRKSKHMQTSRVLRLILFGFSCPGIILIFSLEKDTISANCTNNTFFPQTPNKHSKESLKTWLITKNSHIYWGKYRMAMCKHSSKICELFWQERMSTGTT